MPEPLKNCYSEAFLDRFIESCNTLIPSIDAKAFKKSVFNNQWSKLELKGRMSRIAQSMDTFLPASFEEAAPMVVDICQQLIADKHAQDSFEYLFLAEYIEKKGINFPTLALDCMEKITTFTSCEFAIRPFIIAYPKESMQRLLLWTAHTHPSVRRLASEGCRPRLPWAMALPAFKKDPTPVIQVLEKLKSDPSLYVRRSVANNLNDISKDHPQLIIDIAKQWIGDNGETDWLVKHACRSLLKEGNPAIMPLFGYAEKKYIRLQEFKLETPQVKMNSSIDFYFNLENNSNSHQTFRLEYGIYFLKKNRSLSRKVFKISERTLAPKEALRMIKSHKIKPISTRVYYAGSHQLSLIINGIEYQKENFTLHLT